MSVTVADLMKLPSLREARVIGGHGGLSRIVSSISVLEAIDPTLLVDDLFQTGEFFGSEIVITGFLNCLDDVERQYQVMKRLAEGGEVGLILFYVGVYLPRVDRRLIALANEMDFVLIQMPTQRNLRYGEVISNVMEHIYADQAENTSIVSDILARVSRLPEHQRTVNTALRMVSDRIMASILLSDGMGNTLNLAAWPQSVEPILLSHTGEPVQGGRVPSFLPNSTVCTAAILPDAGPEMRLTLIKEGEPLSELVREQVIDTVRICLNIWGRGHNRIAIGELIRAILQDDPIKMRRLADIFRIDIARIQEMWILSGEDNRSHELLQGRAEEFREELRGISEVVFSDLYEGELLLFASVPASQREAEEQMAAMLEKLRQRDPTITLTRFSNLQSTGEVRAAYLMHREYLPCARKIFPLRPWFDRESISFARECQGRIAQGEQAALAGMEPLKVLRTFRGDWNMTETLGVYLLDADSGITGAAELLHLHKNTVKYRLRVIGDLLGFRPDRMPEKLRLYYALGMERLFS